jgi:pyridoxal phosphate enzyme (YggS family)
MSVAERLELVRQRIAAATSAAGRAPNSVRLVAVSKFQPASAIREAYGAGQRDFGENYVQELLSKAEELANLTDLRFHLIGHLQRNKARKVAAIAAAVQSVDSLELAQELGRRAAASEEERRARFGADWRLRVFVESNIAGEAQKGGVSDAELGAVLDQVESEAALELVGLMCVPPLGDAAAARPHFDRLVGLRERHGGARRLPELSMGMTADLEQAIAAGATIVRVGTAIFGERARPEPAP